MHGAAHHESGFFTEMRCRCSSGTDRAKAKERPAYPQGVRGIFTANFMGRGCHRLLCERTLTSGLNRKGPRPQSPATSPTGISFACHPVRRSDPV